MRLSRLAGSKSTSTPIKVRKLGHVVFRVSDVERSTRFWTEIMGFSISDRNERGMVFLRHGSDHHSIALAAADPGEGLPGRSVSASTTWRLKSAALRSYSRFAISCELTT